MRRLGGLVGALAVLVAAVPASAQGLAPEVVPVFAQSANNCFTGPTEFVVRLRNDGARAAEGEVRVEGRVFGDDGASVTRAPFSVAAGATVALRIPVEVKTPVDLTLVHGDGSVGTLGGWLPIPEQAVRIFDGSTPSRIKPVLDGLAVAADYNPVPYSSYGPSSGGGGPRLRVVSAQLDPATGAPLLPSFVSTWNGVHLAVLPSSVLVQLGGAELEALSGFVLAGGTLAVVPSKPEDLRHPTLVALLGGEASATPAGDAIRAELPIPALRTASPAPRGTGPVTPTLDPLPFLPATAPGESVRLSSYSGGNLVPSPFGASAAYGLGEVVLLGFDTSRPSDVDDPWVRWRVVELARRAHDRRSLSVVMPATVQTEPHLPPMLRGMGATIRRQLDPNRSARWGIGVATLIVCGYAVVAGPVVFNVAKRKNRPLYAIVLLPILSLLTFVLIVALGLLSRGTGRTARHLSVIDLGAGMGQGVAAHHRGFFSPGTQTVEAAALSRTGMLEVDASTVPRVGFVVDRDGVRATGIDAMPSQTVVVQETSTEAVGGGIAIVPSGGGEVTVVNRTGRELRGVLLKLPDDSFRWMPRISDGQRVASTDMERPQKKLAEWTASMPVKMLGSVRGRGLGGPMFVEAYRALGEVDLGESWVAVEGAAPGGADWFPEHVPVLLAEVAGDPVRARDSGVKVDEAQTLVRVVGWGGAP